MVALRSKSREKTLVGYHPMLLLITVDLVATLSGVQFSAARQPHSITEGAIGQWVDMINLLLVLPH